VTVAAVADACDADGNPRFNVVGLDLDTAEGLAKIAAINSARIPIATNRSRKPAGWRISNEQTADPRYATAAAGDVHLLTGSPALGYTDAVFSPAVDYEGTPRPAGAEDAGAYERAGG